MLLRFCVLLSLVLTVTSGVFALVQSTAPLRFALDQDADGYFVRPEDARTPELRLRDAAGRFLGWVGDRVSFVDVDAAHLTFTTHDPLASNSNLVAVVPASNRVTGNDLSFSESGRRVLASGTQRMIVNLETGQTSPPLARHLQGWGWYGDAYVLEYRPTSGYVRISFGDETGVTLMGELPFDYFTLTPAAADTLIALPAPEAEVIVQPMYALLPDAVSFQQVATLPAGVNVAMGGDSFYVWAANPSSDGSSDQANILYRVSTQPPWSVTPIPETIGPAARRFPVSEDGAWITWWDGTQIFTMHDGDLVPRRVCACAAIDAGWWQRDNTLEVRVVDGVEIETYLAAADGANWRRVDNLAHEDLVLAQTADYFVVQDLSNQLVVVNADGTRRISARDARTAIDPARGVVMLTPDDVPVIVTPATGQVRPVPLPEFLIGERFSAVQWSPAGVVAVTLSSSLVPTQYALSIDRPFAREIIQTADGTPGDTALSPTAYTPRSTDVSGVFYAGLVLFCISVVGWMLQTRRRVMAWEAAR